MSTPNNTAPDFGEPWQNELGDFEIYPRTGGDAVAYAEGAKTRDRVIACVNACAGMRDPSAEVQALRDAVKEAREAFEDLMSLLPDVPPWAHTEATLALSKLKALA